MPNKKEALELRRKRAASAHFHIEPAPGELPTYRVESSSGGTYRVLLPEFPSREGAQCSCPDFLSRGLGTCKHLEAVLAYAALNPPRAAPPKAVVPFDWSELERRTDLLVMDPPPGQRSAVDLAKRMRRLGSEFLG